MTGQRSAARASNRRVYARRAVRIALVAREDSRKAFCHQGPEEGEARAYYAHVCFDGGPGCCGGVVVGLVGAVGYGDEGLEAQDGDDAYAVHR